MQAGNLRKRLTLQQKISTRDAWGQPVLTWTDICTVWAEVDALSGKEALHAKQVESEVNSKVTVRYRTELADPRAVNAWRFTFDSGLRVLDINACLYADQKKRYVTLLCSEGLNDGGS